jgi:tRNA(Arg) A34 adenosine deaminase TadA
MVALVVAQQIVGDFDLGGEGQPSYELVASTEPCSMCFGAVPWSGVRHPICGTRSEDAEVVGFDEGPKRAEWVRSLRVRRHRRAERAPRRGRLHASVAR